MLPTERQRAIRLDRLLHTLYTSGHNVIPLHDSDWMFATERALNVSLHLLVDMSYEGQTRRYTWTIRISDQLRNLHIIRK